MKTLKQGLKHPNKFKSLLGQLFNIFDYKKSQYLNLKQKSTHSLQENHSFATDISVANPLQTYKNPLQISISNGFATEVLCCKKPCCNFAHFGIRLQKTNRFATELFRCYIATNFTSVANSVAKSQKSKDNE